MYEHNREEEKRRKTEKLDQCQPELGLAKGLDSEQLKTQEQSLQSTSVSSRSQVGLECEQRHLPKGSETIPRRGPDRSRRPAHW